MVQVADPPQSTGKHRHGSGTSIKVSEGRRLPAALNSPAVNKSPTGSPKPLRVNQNERFHSDLLSNFFQVEFRNFTSVCSEINFFRVQFSEKANKDSFLFAKSS